MKNETSNQPTMVTNQKVTLFHNRFSHTIDASATITITGTSETGLLRGTYYEPTFQQTYTVDRVLSWGIWEIQL